MLQKIQIAFSILVFFCGLYGGAVVCASQNMSDLDRESIMEQEMDCVTQHINSSNEVTWDSTCSAQYFSNTYDIARNDLYEGPSQASNYKADSEHSDVYQYVKNAQLEAEDYSGEMDPVYEPEWNHKADQFVQADFKLLTGYRFDEFDFNIASDLTGLATPNIISELTWSDLKMTQIKGAGNIILNDVVVLDGMVAYADIYDGDNQDSDYDGNDRTGEFSRSNNNSKDGEAMEWSGGSGIRLDLSSERNLLSVDDLWLTFLGGYSYREINLIMTDGFQTIPATGSFAGLHSNFWADWKGPWAGFELAGSRERISGMFRFEYHWTDYYASANWNLRPDFEHPTSYEQWADGRGLVFNLGTDYKITENWALNFQIDFQDWETDPGFIRFFMASGARPEQRLNKANWRSKAFMLGSSYRF